MEEQYRTYKYRWVILAVLAPIIISTQIFWLTLSPISSIAEEYYHVGSMSISMFTTSYLIMFIIFTFPASWVIDKFGYRRSVIIGSLVVAIFGSLRAVFASDFTAVMIFQFAVAAAQPFLLNISTKVPANWFPVSERSIAAGILTMSQFLGFIVPMVLSPLIVSMDNYETAIPELYKLYAIIACISTVIVIAFTREKPPIKPGPEAEKEDLSLASMLKLFKNRNFIYVLVIAFVSVGVFNALLTLIESILGPRGFTPDEAGLVGAVFVVAGVIGAVVLPIISDKIHRRVPLFVIGISMLVPLYIGITFLTDFALLMIIAAAAGFTIMGVAPVLFQHGAEVAYPVKEGTSFGTVLLMGQISGALFVVLFEAISGTGSVTIAMLLFVVLTAVQIPFAVKMKESNILTALRQKNQ